MATDFKDLSETIGAALGNVARDAVSSVSSNGHRPQLRKANGALSGPRGVAAAVASPAMWPVPRGRRPATCSPRVHASRGSARSW